MLEFLIDNMCVIVGGHVFQRREAMHSYGYYLIELILIYLEDMSVLLLVLRIHKDIEM
jgi:hypothetical protein